MKKEFSREYMRDNCGCYSVEKMECIFFAGTEKDITIRGIVTSGIPLKDKFWFVIRKTELSTLQKQTIAIDIAEIVLPIFKESRPGDNRPREAINAAKQYLAGHIDISDLLKARYAAYDAYVEAIAAVSDAAYAAYVATDDDAYAAAAAAADAAYADAAYSQKLTDYLMHIINTY